MSDPACKIVGMSIRKTIGLSELHRQSADNTKAKEQFKRVWWNSKPMYQNCESLFTVRRNHSYIWLATINLTTKAYYRGSWSPKLQQQQKTHMTHILPQEVSDRE